MNVSYDQLDSSSRVWIYQADRKLTDAEVNNVQTELSRFTDGWNAHGTPIRGLAEVRHQLFVLLFADENASEVSGCSIDGSVHLLQRLGSEMGVDFFGRLTLACETATGISLIHRNDLNDALRSGHINLQTRVFENTVSTKEAFESGWKKVLQESWAANALDLPAV